MNKDALDYTEFIDKAIKGAIKFALKKAEKAKIGNFCFTLSIDTKAKGVKIPSYVKRQHPNELIIVLQYNFDNLKVKNTSFSVDLKFDKGLESITIPFDAVRSFNDQIAGVELRFNTIDYDDYYGDDYDMENYYDEYEEEEEESYDNNLIMFTDIKGRK